MQASSSSSMHSGGIPQSSETIPVFSFDGQTVWHDAHSPLFEVGSFLGGGAAGTVYECEYVKTHEHYALKILNPIGFKMITPALLRKCGVVVKGKVVNDVVNDMEPILTREDVWWLINGSTKQFVGAYYSEKHNTLKELSLSQCIQIYGPEPAGVGEEDSGDADSTVEILQNPGGSRIYVPSIPPKYADFVRKRTRIFREIRNMRKISTHLNVIRLEGVLELTQETKCTIFLVMELANGGELFDRIKIDYGTREGTAKYFFMQLLEGVRHCHEQGVCHRDLKPENLLLQDSPSGTTLKIADFGFSARFAMENASHSLDYGREGWQGQPSMIPHQVVHTSLTPSSPSSLLALAESPLRVLKSVVGSPFYVAPEVLQARGYDGPRADVWSLGVILYAMLAGNLPFGQELGTCKRFRHFCKWVRDQVTKSARFWEDPALEYPPWLFPAKFSVQAKGLIVSMLHPDPSCRITVMEAMAHPLCAQESPPPCEQEVIFSGVITDQVYEMAIAEVSHGNPNATVSQQHPQIAAQINDVHLVDNNKSSNTQEAVMTGNDDERCNNDDDDDGGVFRMEEDGDEEETQNTIDWSSQQAQQSLSQSSVTQGSKASSYGTGYSLGSPLSQSSQNQPPLPPVAPIFLHSTGVHDLIIDGSDDHEDDVDSPSSARLPRTQQTSETSAIPIVPPAFNDSVKRSTRFITAVPAAEVLEKVERVLEDCKFHKVVTPIGTVGKIEMKWQDFRLEVWGSDIHGPPLCALQLYQMPADISGTPTSPSHLLESHGEGAALTSLSRQLFLVEFIRGQLEIFPFKRFYQFVRLRVSELVKRDYSYKMFDSSASPMVDSTLLTRFQMGSANSLN